MQLNLKLHIEQLATTVLIDPTLKLLDISLHTCSIPTLTLIMHKSFSVQFLSSLKSCSFRQKAYNNLHKDKTKLVNLLHYISAFLLPPLMIKSIMEVYYCIKLDPQTIKNV